jgi:hypothetical protein
MKADEYKKGGVFNEEKKGCLNFFVQADYAALEMIVCADMKRKLDELNLPCTEESIKTVTNILKLQFEQMYIGDKHAQVVSLESIPISKGFDHTVTGRLVSMKQRLIDYMIATTKRLLQIKR